MTKHTASVLIVEDDQDIRDAVQGVLEAEGYTVMTAENGQDALSVLQGGVPCVVLLDLMMPVMNGFEFMNEVKANKTLEEIPVIVVSAYSERGDTSSAKRVLKKPLDVNKLLGAVGEYCCCPPRPRDVQH